MLHYFSVLSTRYNTVWHVDMLTTTNKVLIGWHRKVCLTVVELFRFSIINIIIIYVNCSYNKKVTNILETDVINCYLIWTFKFGDRISWQRWTNVLYSLLVAFPIIYFYLEIKKRYKSGLSLGLVLWCVTQLSTIFQLYSGGQLYWWRKP